MNKIILIGNLTRNPECQTTSNGINVCKFALAVARKFKNMNGEREVDYINIVAWRGLADNCEKYLSKGSKCCVSGSLQTRSYDKDGEKRYISEVIAEDVTFLTPPQNARQAEVVNSVQEELEPIEDITLPF